MKIIINVGLILISAY